ncbi:triphosphoribosyl-dephospho-CoA synthase [Mesorhizobium sp. J18]|uniref:triphosphoribosyl-dephospho-CoA synthase n=1 Tax=Mesorhizobium sp. J18 TaxID=935263 RepID=UPI00119A2B05|nr:triphosphoribosyl-dephospho-CoA synthase [Mesorhizobium sp. J18]TWG99487.1 triphosphoribosyl-dephospho-CoA synthase [Mesorhizobium sp. J18]
MLSREAIQDAYVAACRAEIDALKPGNVHRFADGHRMTVDEFLISAHVSAPLLSDPKLSTGRRILEAVRATRDAVKTNTNLGIILLCAPLARAAELDLEQRSAVAQVLASMDLEDTKAAFKAIVLASPGGLGSAPSHDVREEPQISLVQAMREAADRDMIARQYATDFREVFETGVATLQAAQNRGEGGMWPTVFAYLAFLSTFPDSHIARKHGLRAAEKVRSEAQSLMAQLTGIEEEAGKIRKLLEFDTRLKAEELNPGTSADLTVASLFAHNLSCNLHN